MPIPEDLLNQIKCCLNKDSHIVHEPVLLKCGFNACKMCCSDPDTSTVKCFSCHTFHHKTEISNAPNNEAINSIIQTYLKDLYQDLNLKQESIKGLGLSLGYYFI
jgi:hypothetical protein